MGSTSETAVHKSHKTKSTSIILESGYSRSMNMKGTYGNNAGKSLLYGIGVKHYIFDKTQLGLSLTQRSGYRYNKVIKTSQFVQDIDVTTLLASVSYDIISLMDNKLTPFIELGVGISQIKPGPYTSKRTISPFSSVTSFGNKKTNFAYSAMLGTTLALNNHLDFALGIRHINLGEATANLAQFSGSEFQKGKLKANEISVSLVIKL